VALGITNNRMPAYLNAMVAVGIVVGAGLAARFVTLEKANRALVGGVLLGVAVCFLAITRSTTPAFLLLTIVGAAGGFFVVPLNALLQEKGRQSVGSGHAIAIQNLAENSAMLLMIGAYTAIVWAGASVTTVAASFGAILSLTIAALWRLRVRAQRRRLSLGSTAIES
jgi:LPLT family lysophospholipid transporter-like MFS transporter